MYNYTCTYMYIHENRYTNTNIYTCSVLCMYTVHVYMYVCMYLCLPVARHRETSDGLKQSCLVCEVSKGGGREGERGRKERKGGER